MKNFVSRMVVIVAVFSLLSISAFAKTSKKDVTFSNEITVNGTLVKAGSYTAVFDDATGQLSIMKGNKTMATATATLEKLEKEANSSVSYSTNRGALTSIGMKNGYQAVLSTNGASTGNSGM